MAVLDKIATKLMPSRALRRGLALAEANKPAEAFSMIAAAARAGVPEAELRIAQCYLDGEGVPVSRAEAARWLRRASDKGNAQAQALLAGLYMTGLNLQVNDGDHSHLDRLFEQDVGGDPDFAMAHELALKSAEGGSANGQALLAYILTVGPPSLRNLEQAYKWYLKSAEAGCAEGSLGLALLLAQRNGDPAEKARMMSELKSASEAGLPTATYILAVVSEQGIGTIIDLPSAAKLYREAAEQGLPSAQFRLGTGLVEGRFGEVDEAEGIAWLRRSALGGVGEAACYLGDYYTKAQPPDFKEAATWYQRSIDAGYSAASRQLASLYLTGYGVMEDRAEAERLLRVAADGGNLDASADLANLVMKDPARSHDAEVVPGWFREAAQGGDFVAAFNLGLCFAKGVGVPQDDRKAAQWVRRAAEEVAEAQYMYGRILQEGRGVPVDLREARIWYARAAAAGIPDARVALAEMLLNGDGGSPMPDMAAQLFTQAAKAGHPSAMYALGVLYDTGGPLPKDAVESRKWLNAAASHGHEMAAQMLNR
ncbi:MAG: hypothetical protein QM744_10165 [Mesorhizobium sp.]